MRWNEKKIAFAAAFAAVTIGTATSAFAAKFAKSQYVTAIGKTTTLKVVGNKKAAYDWRTEAPWIATPDQKGRVYGYRTGSTKIWVACDGKWLTTTVKVVRPVSKLSVKTSAGTSLKVGATFTAKATASPSNATDKSVKWKTSNSKVVDYRNGKFYAKAAGEATITATASDGFGAKASVKIKVTKPAAKKTTSAVKKTTSKTNASVAASTSGTKVVGATQSGSASSSAKKTSSGSSSLRIDSNVSGMTAAEAAAYKRMIALRSKYPTGTPWDDSRKYDFYGQNYRSGYGCQGFALMLNDAAFARTYEDFKACEKMSTIRTYFGKIRVGDVIRTGGVGSNGHSVAVLKVSPSGDEFLIAEANVNGKVLWGSVVSKSDLLRNFTYVLTGW